MMIKEGHRSRTRAVTASLKVNSDIKKLINYFTLVIILNLLIIIFYKFMCFLTKMISYVTFCQSTNSELTISKDYTHYYVFVLLSENYCCHSAMFLLILAISLCHFYICKQYLIWSLLDMFKSLLFKIFKIFMIKNVFIKFYREIHMKRPALARIKTFFNILK